MWVFSNVIKIKIHTIFKVIVHEFSWKLWQMQKCLEHKMRYISYSQGPINENKRLDSDRLECCKNQVALPFRNQNLIRYATAWIQIQN